MITENCMVHLYDEEVRFFDQTKQTFIRYPFADVELMQYTGLKDKNGKEIYEGDVVRFFWSPETGYRVNGEDGATEMIDIVKFEDGCFFFFSDIGSGAFAFRHNENCEVIGNVWETPELLK